MEVLITENTPTPCLTLLLVWVRQLSGSCWAVVRQLLGSCQAFISLTSNCHKSVKIAVSCAAYGTESIFNLVFT